MKAPSFSIIFHIYCNQLDCIYETINSILKQTYQKFELIIIDNSLDDSIYGILSQKYDLQLKSGKIIYKKINRSSIGKAINEGLKLAKNDWITYIESNDVMMSYFLGVFAKEILKNPNIKNFYAQYQFVNGVKINWHKHIFSLKLLKDQNFINLSTYIHHKSLIDEIGMFDENENENEISLKNKFILNQCIMYNPNYVSLYVLKSNKNSNCGSISNSKLVDNKSKIVCYTCITDGYDQILDPLVVSPGIDFICFSDKQIQSKIWKWKQIPKEIESLDKIRQQRSIKICPHKYLKEYDISIWVDGNIQIKNDLNKFIKQYNLDVCPLWIRKHPARDCIYDEAKECIAQRKAPKEVIEKQVLKYKAVNYPAHNKLVESGIILRKHNDTQCQKICDVWFAEVLTESYRDQLSFNYACWATKFRYGTMIYDNVIIDNKNKFFNWNRFHSKLKAKSFQKNQQQFDQNYITIAICNFNTTELTTNCIKSIFKNSKLNNIKFIILDNSYSNNAFQMSDALNSMDIRVIDNTHGKIIDFNSALKKFSKIPIKANNNGSLKHCLSIQFLLNICRSRDLLLFDSDTLLLKNIDFINPSYITVADLEKKDDPCTRSPSGKYLSETRFLPFIQYFNCELINKNQLKYFYPDRIHGGLTFSGNYYDTGASFYEDVINKNLIFKRINYKEYIKHLDHGSWRNLTK